MFLLASKNKEDMLSNIDSSEELQAIEIEYEALEKIASGITKTLEKQKSQDNTSQTPETTLNKKRRSSTGLAR